jgi:hypothetical protein
MTEKEWLDGEDVVQMLHFLQSRHVNRSKRGRRRLRLFGVACAWRVRDAMSERGRTWFDIGARYAEGLVRDEERSEWSKSEWAFPDSRLEYGTQPTADYAARATLEPNVMFVAQNPAHNAAGVRGIAGVPNGSSGLDYANERKAQANLLREIFGNPIRPSTVDGWRNRTVVALAQGVDEGRIMPERTLEVDRFAILADAIEDAGCRDADMLKHCRSQGLHVPGCWVIDLLLDRT